MKCLVCHASSAAADAVCPQCGHDSAAPGAKDPRAISTARRAFRDRTLAYAPTSRVRPWDKIQPWLAVLLGFVIFVFWLRACSSGGFRLW
jgi:hypothetical protein